MLRPFITPFCVDDLLRLVPILADPHRLGLPSAAGQHRGGHAGLRSQRTARQTAPRPRRRATPLAASPAPPTGCSRPSPAPPRFGGSPPPDARAPAGSTPRSCDAPQPRCIAACSTVPHETTSPDTATATPKRIGLRLVIGGVWWHDGRRACRAVQGDAWIPATYSCAQENLGALGCAQPPIPWLGRLPTNLRTNNRIPHGNPASFHQARAHRAYDLRRVLVVHRAMVGSKSRTRADDMTAG